MTTDNANRLRGHQVLTEGDFLQEPYREVVQNNVSDVSELSASSSADKDREKELQKHLYDEGRGCLKNADVANSIKRILKERIFPKVKILSGTETQYSYPDFVTTRGPKAQSRVIGEILVSELNLSSTLENKVKLWITYRNFVKQQLVKFRSNIVEDIKNSYMKGEDWRCDDLLNSNDLLFISIFSLLSFL